MFVDWLKSKIDMETAKESLNSDVLHLNDLELSSSSNSDFIYLKERFQLGDKLWRFSSPKESWLNMCGRAGICIVRDKKVVAYVITVMN